MATAAKPKHKEARSLYLQHLDMHPGKTVNNDLDPLEAGIVGDSEHGSGYHLSRQDNDADDYSVDESARDRRGRSDYASAMDIGYFSRTTPRGTFDLYDYNRWLIGLCNAGDPDTADLREVIYSLDGRTVKRWDRLKRRTTGDSSHRTHTHLSEHRDADGHRMVNLATRWFQHIGLLGGTTVTPAERAALITELLNRPIPYAGFSGDVEKTWQNIHQALYKGFPGDWAITKDLEAIKDGVAANTTAINNMVISQAKLANMMTSLVTSQANAFDALVTLVSTLTGKVSGVEGAVAELHDLIVSGGGSPDTVAILAGVDTRVSSAVTEINAHTTDAVADLGEGGSAQVRADQD